MLSEKNDFQLNSQHFIHYFQHFFNAIYVFMNFFSERHVSNICSIHFLLFGYFIAVCFFADCFFMILIYFILFICLLSLGLIGHLLRRARTAQQKSAESIFIGQLTTVVDGDCTHSTRCKSLQMTHKCVASSQEPEPKQAPYFL